MKKTKLIAAAVLFLLGIGSLLFSLFAHTSYTDVFSLSEADLGRSVTVWLSQPMPIDDQRWLLYYEDGDENAVELCAVLPKEMVRSIKRYAQSEKAVPVTGILRQTTQELHDAAYGALLDYFDMLAQIADGYHATEEERENLHSYISPYSIEVTALNQGTIPVLKRAAMAACCVLFLAAVLVLIAALSGKAVWKIVLTALLIILIPSAVIGVIFCNKLRALFSIRADGEGAYYMESFCDCDLDGMLDANITSDKELEAWMRKTVYANLPLTFNLDRFGCAAFSAKTPDGDTLMGRNFDYPETDTLMIYSHPKNGYASYGMADLEVMNISSGTGGYDPDSLPGRIAMLGAPYLICDGVNEAGLGVSTLELEIGEQHTDTGKPDLYIYTAVRLLLDRCATVDEAVEVLSGYDVHSHAGVRQHLFLAEKSGRSAVVEWIGDEMYVNDLDAVTNSVVTPCDRYDEGADSRLPCILEGLGAHDRILTAEQVRGLLESVSQPDYTEWSCVYDLSHFSVDVYADEDFAHAYHYGS